MWRRSRCRHIRQAGGEHAGEQGTNSRVWISSASHVQVRLHSAIGVDGDLHSPHRRAVRSTAQRSGAYNAPLMGLSTITRSFAGALLAGVLLAGVVAGRQAPTTPQLSGAAAPPTSKLSLWYRAPASDIRWWQWPRLVARGAAGGPGGVGAGAAGGHRPPRRDGLRRGRPRAPAAERRHVMGRAALRSGQPRGESGPAGGAPAARRRQVS